MSLAAADAHAGMQGVEPQACLELAAAAELAAASAPELLATLPAIRDDVFVVEPVDDPGLDLVWDWWFGPTAASACRPIGPR